MYKAEVDRNEYGYFVKLKNHWSIEIDEKIAQYLNLKLDYYQNYLADKFNGNIIYFERSERSEVYFKQSDDALEATEWVDSLLIAAQLFTKE